jgi:hypothetical protein
LREITDTDIDVGITREHMKKNIGTSDRLLRACIGLIFLLIAWWLYPSSGIASSIFFVIALFTFYEALAGWCALYQLLGKNSCDIDPD